MDIWNFIKKNKFYLLFFIVLVLGIIGIYCLGSFLIKSGLSIANSVAISASAVAILLMVSVQLINEQRLTKQLNSQDDLLTKQLTWKDEKKAIIALAENLLKVISESYDKKLNDLEKEISSIAQGILYMGEPYTKNVSTPNLLPLEEIEYFLNRGAEFDENYFSNKFKSADKLTEEDKSFFLMEYDLSKKFFKNFRNTILFDIVPKVELFYNLPEDIRSLIDEYRFYQVSDSMTFISEDRQDIEKIKYYLKTTPLIIKIYRCLSKKLKTQ